MSRSPRRWVMTRVPVLLLALLLFGAAPHAGASNAFRPEPVRVYSGATAIPWERVEVLTDPHPDIKPEAFATGGGHVDANIIRYFGTPTPPSAQVLLHCAAGFAQKTLPHPILLVHGAGDNADRAWANPYRQADITNLESKHWGMAQWLSQLGYSVFAVTFAHRNGCNIVQAEQVANAIARVRRLLRRENDPGFKVDIIAHSKGNLAARLYCSDAPQVFPDRAFLTPFRHDVRTWVAVGSPMMGMDSPFRYYGYNLLRATMPLLRGSAPMAAEAMLVNGLWQQFPADNYHGDGHRLWPGQAQCLYNLVRDGGISLSPDSHTPADLNYTMNTLYFGGQSLFLSSKGIDAAIELGERFMYRLNARGIDPSVRLLALAGNKPMILEEGVPASLQWVFLIGGLIQQTCAHPSDGAVFVKNALRTDEVLRRGAPLLETTTLPLNHLDLARDRKAIQYIDTWLMKP